jgi:O-antigen/teichoic acid export membrane protein
LKQEENRLNTVIGFVFINIVRAIIGVARNKILAVYHGVASIGLLGQFLSFDGMLGKVVLFGSTASLVNTYHHAKQLKTSKDVVILTHLVIISISGSISTGVLLLFANYFAKIIYLNENLISLIYLGVCLNIIYISSTLTELIFQAKREFKRLFRARIIGVIAGIITVYPLLYSWAIEGVIINTGILYLSTWIYLIYKLYKNVDFRNKKLNVLLSSLNIQLIAHILKVSSVDFLRAFIVFSSLLIVRIMVIQLSGEIVAGFYHALLSISNYLNIILEGFVVYYYPQICSINEDSDLKKEINLNFEMMFYIIFPVIIGTILFAEEILLILYTGDFQGIVQYLVILTGFKILYLYYYFFSINYLAKNYLRKFLFIESARSIFLVISTYFFILKWQLPGAVYSIVLTDILSVLLIWLTKFNINKFKLDLVNKRNMVIGMALIVFILFSPFSTIPNLLLTLTISLILFDYKKYILTYMTIKKKT